MFAVIRHPKVTQDLPNLMLYSAT